ncbi:hypothetical protein ABMA28_010439 [Loxostege sticticalis]|uniref:C2H2-type domain-containing protein n=1 Tax=Loxostege sticticalis TaxID=481309 RepID=A0ABD0S887_LOXSC
MDFLNIILNPEKLKSMCFLCLKQKDETSSVYRELFVCDEYISSDTTLADIMNYLFPSHDILCSQACEDCSKVLISMYTRLRKHDFLKQTLSAIISNLTKEVSGIDLCKVVSKNHTISLKIPVVVDYLENVLHDDEGNTKQQSAKLLNNFCQKCDMKFMSKEFLTEHYRIAHKNINQAVICEFCGKDCKKPSTLRVHLNCHKEKVCPYCSKTLKSHSHYQIHLKNHKTKVVRPSKKITYYSCDMCSYRGVHKNSLEAHTNKVHLRTRPYVCEICEKGFYRKSHLTEHISTHANVKNFTCELCGDEFVAKKTLTEHIRLHTGERPYQCEICNKRFVSSGRRSDHFKSVHMEKTHCCFLCDKKYGLKKELNTHMKKIHGHYPSTS